MKNTIRNLMLVSGFTALASLAPAQALRGAAGAAGNVRVPVLPPPPAAANAAAQSATAATMRPPLLPPPTAAAAGVGAQGASAATVRPPMTVPVSANAAAAAQGHVASVPAGVPNVQAQTHASAQGQAAGAAFAGSTSNRATVTLETGETVKAIRESAFATRDHITARVQARLDASAAVVANLRARADASGEKSRAALAKALVELRQREKELRASLKASTKATGESSWGEVQSALAKDYGAYAQALIQAEAAAQGDASTEPKS